MAQKLQKLKASDICLGEPLQFSVYDEQHILLLRKGIVISMPAQLERLINSGCFMGTDDLVQAANGAPEPFKQNIPTFVRAEECCAKLKSLFVSLFRMPDQTDATAKCGEIAGLIRAASERNSAVLLASLQIESNIPYLIAHQVMGAVLVEQVGKLAGFSDAERSVLTAAALTRDLGMAALQTELDKIHGPLPDALKAQMQCHPRHSIDLLRRAGVSDECWLLSIEQHHERIDGTGYPLGLTAEQISKGARLLSICDIFSAMIKPRPYHQNGHAKVPQSALRDIFLSSGKTLDQEYSALLIKAVGIIPPGSIVKLKNNEIALVIAPISNPKAGMALTIYDVNQMPVIEPVPRDTSLPEHEIIGMARHEECRSAQLIIKHILMKD